MQRIKIEPFEVIGIEVRTTNEKYQSAKDLAELWQKFLSENILSEIPNKVDNTIYSIYTNYESDHTKPYTTVLGCRVKHLKEIPTGMTAWSFKGGTYMKTTARGDVTKGLIADQWKKIWQMDIKRAYTADFEVYGEKAQDPVNCEVDFCIAVNE